MMNDELFFNASYSIISLTALTVLNIAVADAASWVDIVNNLSVPGVLMMGLYYLRKMNEKTEEKMEKHINSLLEKIDQSNDEKLGAYKKNIDIVTEMLKASDEERRELQRKIIDSHGKN